MSVLESMHVVCMQTLFFLFFLFAYQMNPIVRAMAVVIFMRSFRPSISSMWGTYTSTQHIPCTLESSVVAYLSNSEWAILNGGRIEA